MPSGNTTPAGGALTTTIPTSEEITLLIIELLAELQERDPSEIQAELVDGGPELPIDSLLIVEILTRVEGHFGISIPADATAARSTRSVRAFTRTVLDAVIEGQQP